MLSYWFRIFHIFKHHHISIVFIEIIILFCNDDNKTSKVEKLFRDQTKNSKENPTSIISAPLHEFQYRKIACILICINWKQGNKVHNTYLKNHFSTCYSKHFFHNVSIIYCLRLDEEEIKNIPTTLNFNMWIKMIFGSLASSNPPPHPG